MQQADAPVGQQCAGGLGVVGRDGLQITLPGVIADTRLDRNMRESLPTRDTAATPPSR